MHSKYVRFFQTACTHLSRPPSKSCPHSCANARGTNFANPTGRLKPKHHHDSIRIYRRAARQNRYRRHYRRACAAEKRRRQLYGLLPVSQRKKRLVFREPAQAVLSLLRLRRTRQRHRFYHGIPRLKLYRSGAIPGRPHRHGCAENTRARRSTRSAPSAQEKAANAGRNHRSGRRILCRPSETGCAGAGLFEPARVIARNHRALRLGLFARRLAAIGANIPALSQHRIGRKRHGD